MTEPITEKYAAVIRAARRAYREKRRIETALRRRVEQTPEWIAYDDARAVTEDAHQAMLAAEELGRTEGKIYLPWE